ncbi:transposase domain-containing protein [Bradyrhizobium sp. CIR3A]|uniref:transposase domain-containing protein n=1 Tax=Bradyrhizobium sp. CIR3A TaxID=2663838 RepID=UPI00390C62CE
MSRRPIFEHSLPIVPSSSIPTSLNTPSVHKTITRKKQAIRLVAIAADNFGDHRDAATLLQTAKTNSLDPLAWLTLTLQRIANPRPARPRVDDHTYSSSATLRSSSATKCLRHQVRLLLETSRLPTLSRFPAQPQYIFESKQFDVQLTILLALQLSPLQAP